MNVGELVKRVQDVGSRTGEDEVLVTIDGEPFEVTNQIYWDDELEAVVIEVTPV